jgi:hypothetical protein
MSIPLRAHFIWFGQSFPWVNVLAVRSAALRGGFEELVLHHDSDLSPTPFYRELAATPGVRFEPIAVEELMSGCGQFAAELLQAYHRLKSPATRSDLLRYALLFARGGVYLDIDTITLADFSQLCGQSAAFCGQERIVYAVEIARSRDLRVRSYAKLRSSLRNLVRRSSSGPALFRRIERLYPLAANPAVLGSEPGSALLTRLLSELIVTPADEQPRPAAIGPHLLQRVLATGGSEHVAVLPPAYFFPLAPEICEHWFRFDTRTRLTDVLEPSTHVVHWYASGRTRQVASLIEPSYVRRHAKSQLFSELALPFVS